MRRSLKFVVTVAVAVAAVRLVKARGPATITTTAPTDPNQRWDPADATAVFDAECPRGTVSPRCSALRGAVLFQLVTALEGMSHTQNEPGDGKIALDALGVREAEVKEAALRVLGRTPNEPGLGPKLVAILLDDPHWELQRLAAALLTSNVDPNLRVLGDQWGMGHPNQIGVVPDPVLPALLWAAAPRLSPSELGFAAPAYPGTTSYSPGDSDRALGYLSRDPVDKVIAFYAQRTAKTPLDTAAWQKWLTDHQTSYFPQPDQKTLEEHTQRVMKKAEKLGPLAEKWAKSQDPKVYKQIQALQAEIDAETKKFQAAMPVVEQRPGVIVVTTPPASEAPQRTGRVFLEGEREGRALRVISIYRDDAAAGTVIQFLWDPKFVVPTPPRPSAPAKP